jgi:hypothetical protein
MKLQLENQNQKIKWQIIKIQNDKVIINEENRRLQNHNQNLISGID